MTEYYPFYAHIWYGLRISRGGDWTSLLPSVGEVCTQTLSLFIVNKQLVKFVNKLTFTSDLYIDWMILVTQSIQKHTF